MATKKKAKAGKKLKRAKKLEATKPLTVLTHQMSGGDLPRP